LPASELHVHAVRRTGEFIGFCSFGEDGRVPGFDYDDSAVDVGAGMRPDLTGRGDGARFLTAILAFARDDLGCTNLRATIAAWNERALRAARAAGFEEQTRFETPDGRRFVVLLSNDPNDAP